MAVLAENRKAHFDYQILETFEAGIELRGFEVKAVKTGRINISGSFALPRATARGSAEIWLVNADIPPYQPKNTPADYDSKRSRRLLLKAGEIKSIIGSLTSKGLRLLPLKVYTRKSLIKLRLGLGRIKRKIDKREAIIKKEVKKKLKNELRKDE